MQRQNIILVFSGSFNPIHTGHIEVLTTIKDALDRVATSNTKLDKI
jgi:cytidyltransferase-like protein